LDPDELADTVATIARPNTVVATSLRNAVTSLQSDLSLDGGPARAVHVIGATTAT